MKLINDDCISAMMGMPDGSVDSIVTDPPYELGFMGNSWDSTGIAFNVEVWKQALRVLKPGGHLLAFSGSRTYHRMAVAIEDAGFEIRDQIMWVYGSGFPKSHNISKAIDKAAGAEREVVGTRKQRVNSDNSLVPMNKSVGDIEEITAPSTDSAKQWDGWGTALKPAHEPIVLARKPFPKGYTVAKNVLEFGTGGLNIDGTRVGSEVMVNPPMGAPQNSYGGFAATAPTVAVGRFPANFIHDGSDEVVELLGEPARFFYCAKASKRDRNEGPEGFGVKRANVYWYDIGLSNAGEGMFKDRNSIKANFHPTVKPTSLMQYLVRLVTPPNGTVLDPFMGSGSTGKACAYEGFDFIGIDQFAEYVEISRARIEFAAENKNEELPI